MNLLAIFSASPQNQKCLVDYRCASKVVGCMNLTSMADDIKLQCYGWVVLGYILLCPPNDITKVHCVCNRYIDVIIIVLLIIARCSYPSNNIIIGSYTTTM